MKDHYSEEDIRQLEQELIEMQKHWLLAQEVKALRRSIFWGKVFSGLDRLPIGDKFDYASSGTKNLK